MVEHKRKVLVTGASRGIGRAIAVALSADGFDVVCHYSHDEDAAIATLKIIKKIPEGNLLKFDVSDAAATESTLQQYIDKYGAFWGIVINAGIRSDDVFVALTHANWQRVLDVNLNGFFNVLRPLVQPLLRLRDGGRIVCVSSLSSSVGVPGQANYAASKAGIEAAARSLALELASRGVTVNCIQPGFIATDMLKVMDEATMVNRVPLKRLGTANEVGALTSFLFSDAAGYITKQSIRIDGGIG